MIWVDSICDLLAHQLVKYASSPRFAAQLDERSALFLELHPWTLQAVVVVVVAVV
jgi:hypothetical protein